MPTIDQRVLASIPKCSTGIIKTDTTSKISKDGKWKGSDQNSLLKNTSKKNRVPVVIDSETPVEQSVYTQQNTRQVYVIQSKPDENGNINRVLIARYEEGVSSSGDPDGTSIVVIDWVDVKHITCGSMADAVITIPGSQPVQSEPEVEVIAAEDDNRMLESFIFFDHFMGGKEKPQEHIYAIERAVGLQREVAKFMGLYNGGKSVSKEKQAKIDKQVHLVPFSDISQDYVDQYPELKANPSPGINASNDNFYRYWNQHVVNSKAHVVVLFNHAGHDGLALLEAGKEKIKMDELINLQIPKIDYILLLGCNLGNLTKVNEEDKKPSNFASTLADLTQGRHSKTSSPTAVVAADGNTYCPVTKKKNFITGICFSVGKYTDQDHKHFDESQGFCIFEKGKQVGEATPIPGTAAVPIKKKTAKDYDMNWTLQNIAIEDLLKKTKKIIQKK